MSQEATRPENPLSSALLAARGGTTSGLCHTGSDALSHPYSIGARRPRAGCGRAADPATAGVGGVRRYDAALPAEPAEGVEPRATGWGTVFAALMDGSKRRTEHCERARSREEAVDESPSRAAPRRAEGVVSSSVSEGAVLLSTEEEIYYGLNETGARAWERLNEAETVGDLLRDLEERYPEVDSDVLRADLEDLLDDLRRHGLVVDPEDG